MADAIRVLVTDRDTGETIGEHDVEDNYLVLFTGTTALIDPCINPNDCCGGYCPDADG